MPPPRSPPPSEGWKCPSVLSWGLGGAFLELSRGTGQRPEWGLLQAFGADLPSG